MHRRIALFLSLALPGVIGVTGAGAGDLNPPSGPVGATDTALRETDPRTPINFTTAPGSPTATHRISSSGSYFLVDDVLAGEGQHAIEIAAPHVKIDLNGYSLIGAGLFTQNSMNGITRVDGTLAGSVTVTNGVIRQFDEIGVRLTADAIVLRDVVIAECGSTGASLSTPPAIVSRCLFLNNGGAGLSAGPAASVSHCVFSGNGFRGINVGSGSVVAHCSAWGNGGTGIDAGIGTLVQACVAYDNDGQGIEIANGSVIDCVARSNGINGILVEDFSGTQGYNGLMRGNTCERNGRIVDGAGIRIDGRTGSNAGTVVVGNAVLGNDIGIRVSSGPRTLVIQNFAFGNSGAGFDVTSLDTLGPVVNISGVQTLDNIANGGHPWANFEY